MRFYPYLIWILLFNAIYACSDTVIYAEKPGAEKVNRPSSYLINCEKQCDQVASQIRAAGGHVRQRYANFDIISFDLADSAAKNVLAQYDVVKDKQIKAPIPVEKHQFPRNKLLLNNGIKSLANEKLLPNSYLSSNRQTGAAAAHAENILGDGVIVAIIDSGTANNSTLVPLIADSVIGGESFVN
ncbi:MAG: hypothetical protein OEX07_04630, partial [Gammaproteobacteria bacterium]|nr:hypothetical protein [Gammaproteobacteria bacterium]